MESVETNEQNAESDKDLDMELDLIESNELDMDLDSKEPKQLTMDDLYGDAGSNDQRN